MTEDAEYDDQVAKAAVAAVGAVAETMGVAATGAESAHGLCADAQDEPVRWRKVDLHSRRQQGGRDAVAEASYLEFYHLQEHHCQVGETVRKCFDAHSHTPEK